MPKTITEEDIKALELQTPEYAFVEKADLDDNILKRPIAKLQNVAATFTLYDVYRVIEQLKRNITEKLVEIDQLRKNQELFEAEAALVEKSLKITQAADLYKELEAPADDTKTNE